MFSRLSNFVSPLSIFKLNTELPLDLVLSLDSGSASSYNPLMISNSVPMTSQ